ncbi:NAD(P)/FAD-dependent oxidoreductase [Lysinibacillus agricola]|uniref:Ferredoxin--NADP reductase n=1 Tax=Lysinibacillus agricola TaxID=2590012 RepID=A0ABX7AS84_9BACI|nr:MULTISPECIES: NAD(P)/FAD-dependent oxidoreductase [Lysinibacillus]KOS61329.1 thioredoxin reductase [Lysinibacillus sp. FJAT-14222]QQP12826.1 NAD(P)/FAD-dependent oxidoreductase [Lysinibacillus agricola]
MVEKELFDVTIIGGGPAGLYSSFYSGLREMKTKLIESQPQLGGKIHVYPEKMIWDIGGLTPITGGQLIDQLIEQALTFNPSIYTDEKVTSIAKNEEGHFVITAESGNIHYSKTVIVAIGGGILNPQKIEIEGAERFEVSNLNYTIKSYEKFKDKAVIISGGGNTAVDWALELTEIASKVYLTYRKEALSAHEAQITELLNSTIECHFNSEITKLIADDQEGMIKAVALMNHETGNTIEIPVDEVVISHGYLRDKELLDNSPLAIERIRDYFIAGTVHSASSIPGLYAAGDILHHEGKIHLIAATFHDALHAVNSAKKYIQPDASDGGIVSSHNDIFKQRNRKLLKGILQ